MTRIHQARHFSFSLSRLISDTQSGQVRPYDRRPIHQSFRGYVSSESQPRHLLHHVCPPAKFNNGNYSPSSRQEAVLASGISSTARVTGRKEMDCWEVHNGLALGCKAKSEGGGDEEDGKKDGSNGEEESEGDEKQEGKKQTENEEMKKTQGKNDDGWWGGAILGGILGGLFG
ncbi:hypothetical protein MMC10_005781 [Thelotrema lepadinum]|nr:hypothetical protein [Thelotrema lepadinum]